MIRRALAGTLALAATVLLPSLSGAQTYRPDRPPVDLTAIPADSAGNTAMVLAGAIDSPPVTYAAAVVSCGSSTLPGTSFSGVTARLDSSQFGAASAKGSQKSWLTVSLTLTDSLGMILASPTPVQVEGCGLKWQLKDEDEDHDYDLGTDTMKASLKCPETLPTTLGLSATDAAAFLAAFDGKLSCTVAGIPTHTVITPGCFRGDTLVATAAGPKPIRDVKAGESVWSHDEKTGKDVLAPVVHVFVHPGRGLRDVVAGGETLHTTDEHPFFAEGRGWVKAKDLAPGDKVPVRGGAPVEVTANRSVDGKAFYAGYTRPATPRSAKLADMKMLPAALGGLESLASFDVPESPTVYNLDVGGHHNYYVGTSRVLVHNK